MKIRGFDIWIECLVVALPAIGILTTRLWPQTWLFLAITSVIASLPFFVALLRGFLDRRVVAEIFPSVAFGVLFWNRAWETAAIITVILGALRLIEQSLETRAVAGMDRPLQEFANHARIGDVLIVNTGERIPADGMIIHGTCLVDEHLIRGTQNPLERLVGDRVFAGTTLQVGSIKIRVTQATDTSLLRRLRTAIHEASRHPSGAERLAGHVSSFSYWLLALLAVALWTLFQNTEGLIATLLVLRPDALVAATSLAASLAAASAGTLGAMIRGGESLDHLATADTLVLDKSGPLSFLDTYVGHLEHDPRVSDAYIWECLAVAESGSDHPVGRALYREAARHIGRVSAAESFQVIPGRGVVAQLEGRQIVVGTAELHREYDVAFDGSWLAGSTTPVQGQVADCFLGLDGHCVARVRIEEHTRADIRNTLQELRMLGIKRDILFTPDTVRFAAKQASTIGLSDYRPAMTAEEKWRELGALSRGGQVLFLGDGIEDARAMSRAHVGMAMRADGAPVENASIALHTESITTLPRLIKLARAFRKVIRVQSTVWISAGMIGLILSSIGWLSPVAAAGYAFTTSLILHVIMRELIPSGNKKAG